MRYQRAFGISCLLQAGGSAGIEEAVGRRASRYGRCGGSGQRRAGPTPIEISQQIIELAETVLVLDPRAEAELAGAGIA